jgi:hypothetical protein
VNTTGTSASFYPSFFSTTVGTLPAYVDTGLTYNPSTHQLNAGAFTPTDATVPANGMYLSALNTVTFSTASAERVKITSAGNLTVTGNVYAAGELQSVSTAGGGQVRMIGGNYGTILRNDGANFYILFTASGNQYGGWNTMRPFSANAATGGVNIDATGAGTTFGGQVAIRTGSNAYSILIPGTGASSSSYVGTYNSTNTQIAYSQFWDGTNYYPGVTTTTIPLVFGTNNNERMRIDANGNVAIGISSTTSKFHVLGTAYISGNLTVAGGNVTGSGIILSDDGDIVDLNDGFCSMRFSAGAKIYSANRGGSAVISLNNTGSISANGEITAYASDARLKTDMKPIEMALSKVTKLNGVTFKWNPITKGLGFTPEMENDVGVLAQEVNAVLPEAVRLAPFDRNDDRTSKSGENYLTVQYEKLTALLIEAVKELNTKVVALENEIKELRK